MRRTHAHIYTSSYPQRAAASISPAPSDFLVAPFNLDDLPASQLPPSSQLPPTAIPSRDEGDQGVRVTYEDPVQRERQRRLKEMLTGKVEPRKDADVEMAEAGKDSIQGDGDSASNKSTRARKGKNKTKRSVL